jgi:hypothetical protein
MWVLTVGALGLATVGLTAEPTVFRGTFQDVNGHKGSIQCELTVTDAGKWMGKFDASNTGTGPNKPLSCTLDLTAKTEGSTTKLTGEWQSRAGVYVFTATLVPQKSLKASFRRKEGSGEGTFEMQPVTKTTPAAPTK